MSHYVSVELFQYYGLQYRAQPPGLVALPCCVGCRSPDGQSRGAFAGSLMWLAFWLVGPALLCGVQVNLGPGLEPRRVSGALSLLQLTISCFWSDGPASINGTTVMRRKRESSAMEAFSLVIQDVPLVSSCFSLQGSRRASPVRCLCLTGLNGVALCKEAGVLPL